MEVPVLQFTVLPGGAVPSPALRDKGTLEVEQRDVGVGNRPSSALMLASAATVFVASALAHEAHAQVPAVPPPPVAAGTPGIEAAKQSGGDTKGAEGGNRVNRSIQFGITRDPGAASVMDHKIRDAGIALPQCVEESRGGQAFIKI